MTNYEKLISSIILSAVLSKTTYGLGCGCNCFDDDDDDIENFSTDTKNSYSNTTGNYNNITAIPPSNINKESDSSLSFCNGYEYLITTIIAERSKDNLLQLFSIESQIFNNKNKENEDNISETRTTIKDQNIQLIAKMYKNFQEEYKKEVDENFSYNFYEENKNQIEKLDHIQQLTIVSFLINLINAISEENQTIEGFSKTCLYHNLKNEHNNTTKNILKDFILQTQSPIKNIFQKLRDQLFLSLFNYTTSYLDLCYLKFGEGFWIKNEEKTISLSNFFTKKSDENKTIKNLFLSTKPMFSKYDLYKNVCDMPFSKITNIKEKINSLPSFSEVFEKNNKTYKIKEGQIENFKGYFNFLEENNSNPLEHEKDINKFFTVLPKLNKINATQDKEFVNQSFAFKGLEAPEFKLTEKIKEEEE